MSVAYLDYNASAPLRAEAREAMLAALACAGNPSSVHAAGRAIRQRLAEAREAVAELVGARADQVVFTSGATEANNLALRGYRPDGRAPRILASAVEHVSVLAAAEQIELIPVESSGVVDLGALQRMLAERDWRDCIVSVMAVNNETGVVQPVDEIVRIARAAGAVVHCDAVQAAGKHPFDMATGGIDLLTLSGHKIGAPRGVGALLVGEGVELRPENRGGGQERGLRGGAEAVDAIAGLGAVARLSGRMLEDHARASALTARLESEVRRLAAQAQILGSGAERVGTTSCIALPGVRAETQLMALDLQGVCVSAGSACSSGKVSPSHVLRAMGYGEGVADCAIRVSLGWNSTEDDVGRFLDAYGQMVARLGTAA